MSNEKKKDVFDHALERTEKVIFVPEKYNEMSNEKQWTYADCNDGNLFTVFENGAHFCSGLAESSAMIVCDKFNALLSATARVAELEAQLRKTEWVSVEERLPEEGEKVLILFGEIDNVLMGKNYGEMWTVFFSDGEKYNTGTNAELITHWRPLPEPPSPPPNTKGDDHR